MGPLTQVSIDFETSHLVFPTLIAIVVGVLGIAIMLRDRALIAQAPAAWRTTLADIDKPRFFGTIVLTVLYFSLMVPVGNIWPNTGLGFLICSIPYVFAIGVLYLHERSWRDIIPVAILAAVAPPVAWYLFYYVFFLSLP